MSVLGRTFRWTLRPPAVNRIVDVRIKSKDGRTTVQVTERLGPMAGGLFGGIVGGVGGGGVAGVAMGAAALLGTWAAPFAGVLWIAGTYAAVRAGFARMGARRAQQLAAALDELEREVRERASDVDDGRPAGTRPSGTRARVEPEAADEPAGEHEEARRSQTRGRGA